jgi:hypothetical protein
MASHYRGETPLDDTAPDFSALFVAVNAILFELFNNDPDQPRMLFSHHADSHVELNLTGESQPLKIAQEAMAPKH